MTRKRKIQIHIAAALAVICLIGWIIMLYAQKHQEEKGWEHEFLTRYQAILNDAIFHLGNFEEAKSYEDQLSCLEAVTNDLIQLKTNMEIHVNLANISTPGKMTSTDQSGWHEYETAIGFINNGGTINSYQIESFRADGRISEEEAAIIRFLREEMEKLYGDMTMHAEDSGNYKYVLSSTEVYQRLTAIMQSGKAQLIAINPE